MDNAKKKKKLLLILVLAAVIILILLGYYLWQNGLGFKLPKIGLLGGASAYQAVFLSSGQVYFGQVLNPNSSYVILRDVYYLQVNQVLQPAQGKETSEPQQALSLAKLGLSELHKPKDEMRINRDHIVFIEDMRNDSAVVQAIENYKKSSN